MSSLKPTNGLSMKTEPSFWTGIGLLKVCSNFEPLIVNNCEYYTFKVSVPPTSNLTISDDENCLGFGHYVSCSGFRFIMAITNPTATEIMDMIKMYLIINIALCHL